MKHSGRIWIWMAGIALVATPVGASVYKDFSKAWDERDATYRAEREALDARAASSAGRAVEALVTADPSAEEDLLLALTGAWSLSELVGRGQTLWAFRQHMESKPSAGLSEIWMQGKVDELRRKQTEADLIGQQIEVLGARDTVSVRHWVAALEQLTMLRGNISGAAAELALIDQNLRSYYRARANEPAVLPRLWTDVLETLRAAAQRRQDEVKSWSTSCVRSEGCVRS